MRESGALTVEAWITPAEEFQAGPARIVSLSADHSTRNFTLGQADDAYVMRLRTTATSSNGLPGVSTGVEGDASIAAARSPDRDRAVIFVTHGTRLNVDMDQFRDGLQAEWFDPRTAQRREAVPEDGGYFQPPTDQDWVLVLK